jgi:hypothetical protein
MSSVWPVARLYLLAESFASLRSPPAGTYKDVIVDKVYSSCFLIDVASWRLNFGSL